MLALLLLPLYCVFSAVLFGVFCFLVPCFISVILLMVYHNVRYIYIYISYLFAPWSLSQFQWKFYGCRWRAEPQIKLETFNGSIVNCDKTALLQDKHRVRWLACLVTIKKLRKNVLDERFWGAYPLCVNVLVSSSPSPSVWFIFSAAEQIQLKSSEIKYRMHLRHLLTKENGNYIKIYYVRCACLN